MTFRPPPRRSTGAQRNALDYEIVQEQAAALGRLGRALERALVALCDHDQARATKSGEAAATSAASATVRERLVAEASDALWCFVVQREACGLRDQMLIMRNYHVPREVQNRMGALGARRAPGTAH
jgi:hypothetical protein